MSKFKENWYKKSYAQDLNLHKNICVSGMNRLGLISSAVFRKGLNVEDGRQVALERKPVLSGNVSSQ